MKKLLFVCAMALVWSFGLMLSEAKAQGIIYGGSLTTYNSSARYVEGYSISRLNYYAALYYDPEVLGELYRTDMNEIPLDNDYGTGYANIIDAEAFLFSTNYVEGKTYCTYGTHFIRHYSTGVRTTKGFSNNCKTIPFPPNPTPTQTPTATPTPIITPTPFPTPTPCPQGFGEICEETIISVHISPEVLKPVGTTGGNNTATVSGCLRNGDTPVPNQQINLKVYLREEDKNLGGHIGDEHTGNKHVGRLDKTSGTTGSNGCFTTKYNPSHLSGIVTIEAYRSSTFRELKPVYLGVPNLTQLFEGDNFRLIGDDAPHPSNHWGTADTIAGIPAIANAYKTRFYGENPMPEDDKLRINDISLVLGGKFDLKKTGATKPDWHNLSRIHKYHREGNSVDIRCCQSPGRIPDSRHAEFGTIALNNGATKFLKETRPLHFHLSFNNEPNNVTELANDPLNVHTPNSFVENTYEVIMDRFATQVEWENWHNRLIMAKAAGLQQLLTEAKIFKRELFSESTYLTIGKTDAEFVEGVFWSYLFREPTVTESEYWQNYLQSLPPSLPLRRQRDRLLDEFQLNTEFETLVLGIVDGS